MSDTSNQPDHQITDEVASAYLHDREINCPRCNYPLRNASSSTCPECGCVFGLKPVDPDYPDPTQKLIRFAFLFMALLALTEVVSRGVSLIQVIQITKTGLLSFSGYFAISYITGLTVWSALFLYLLLKWYGAIRGKSYSNQYIKVPAIIVLSAYVTPMLIDYGRMMLN